MNLAPPTDGVIRVQCWSGPRNISTALMYSWRQRADTTVYDEPLYAHYLTRDDRGHPGVPEILASQRHDPDAVISDVILGPCATPVLYIKQMAHHLNGVDRRHLAHTENILLVRHPRDMLASLSVQLPNCELSDTGLVESVELLDAILAEGGSPVVIETQSLLRDPAGVLGQVCERVGLDFDPAVLSWPAGPKPEDGVWAKHWYDNVHASTSFAPYVPSSRDVPEKTLAVLDQAMPLFERLAQFAIS
ncbi:sulfotransferase family protein [bacterium]|nr:sulfotransferase family protein [bacterium]